MYTSETMLTGTWQADVTRSTATFRVGNLGRVTTGTVPVTNGTVDFGPDGTPQAVHGTLDLSAIDTGVPKRDQDLRKPSLLNLDAHPTMTVRATSFEPCDQGWQVTGVLTARGVDAELTGTAELSIVDGETATMTAVARLDRRLLGLKVPRFIIGRYVDIMVTATLRGGQVAT